MDRHVWTRWWWRWHTGLRTQTCVLVQAVHSRVVGGGCWSTELGVHARRSWAVTSGGDGVRCLDVVFVVKHVVDPVADGVWLRVGVLLYQTFSNVAGGRFFIRS